MVETKNGKQFTKKDFLNDLYLFYRYFIASNYVNSVPAPHIKKLSRKLMELHNGTGKHRLAVSMPPRHPLDINTPVFTINRGWVKHGDLCIGDVVLNKKYKKTEVVNVLPRVSVDNCFVFSNGDKIVSGDEHLWYFNDYENDVTRLFTTREIMERKLRIGKSYLSNFKIISPTKTISLIDAYKVEKRQGNCISVKAKDGMYLVGENFTPTHNSKSSMVTLAFPLWLLFQNPNVNIMIVTGSPKLAEKFGIQLREYVREVGKYFNVYLSSVKQASTHIMFCDKDNKLYKGNIMLASSGGGITGQDADYLILDDPYTGNDSEFTPSALQQKIDWVNRVVEQRIEPHTKYCILHTRWHPLKHDTPVLTQNRGWTTHGDLKVGDYVFRPNGEATKVVKVHPPVLVDNCFEFSNGDKIVSGDHHLWNVYDWGNRKQRLMETQEIMKRPTCVGKKKPRCNFLVDCHEPLQFPSRDVPIDPYWLGLWLGDGHHKRPSISCEKKDKISTQSTPYNVVRYDETGDNCLEAFYTHQGLLEKLKELNVYGNKHIPEVYLYNSIDVRKQLLAGLIDSDGSVEKSSNRVVFVNTNKKLLKQVYELITSLGFIVHVEKRQAETMNKHKQKNNTLPIVSRKDAYALRFSPYSEIPTNVLRKKIKGNGVKKRIGLTKKYKIEADWGNCITVESDDGMYLVGRNLTPTHNSNDLIGYYKESDPEAYDFVEFPAIQEDGTPLWSERYTIKELLKKKETVGERVFQSIYQQQPIDMTSDYFNMGMLKFGLPEDFDENYTTRCRAWDIASGNQLSKSDFTAGIYMIRYNDYAIIQDLVHGRFGSKNKQIIVNVAEQDTPNVHIVIETGVGAGAKLLFQEWQTQLMGYMVTEAQVSGGKSKVDRATPLQNAIEDGKVYVNIQDPVMRQAFYDELSSFPNGSHDDITDATAHAFNFLFVDNIGKARPRPKIGAVFL